MGANFLGSPAAPKQRTGWEDLTAPLRPFGLMLADLVGGRHG